MYRKLWLINGDGNKFDFTEPTKKYFLENIDGLGFSKDIDGYELGTIEKVTSSSYDFPEISGDLLFYDEREKGYEDYFNFIKFVTREPLQLYYLPPNTLIPYYCDVQFTSAKKDEYDKNGTMTIPVTFKATSYWLNSNETSIELQNEISGEGKYYDLERPYFYAGTTLSEINLVNNSSNEIGMIVEVVGDVTNPQWTLTQNNTVYGSCKLNGSYDYVKVNSKDGEESIYLEKDSSVITNPASYQDLSITGGVLTFIKLKTGSSILSFTCGNIDIFDGTVKIRYSGSYISV